MMPRVRFDEAMSLLEPTFELRKARLGEDHIDTLDSMRLLAWVYKQAGHSDKALPLFEQTFELRKAKLGIQHLDTLESLADLLPFQEPAQA